MPAGSCLGDGTRKCAQFQRTLAGISVDNPRCHKQHMYITNVLHLKRALNGFKVRQRGLLSEIMIKNDDTVSENHVYSK